VSVSARVRVRLCVHVRLSSKHHYAD